MRAGGARDAPIRVLTCGFGPFRQADRLNPRFLPGHDRMRLTIEMPAREAWPPRETLWRGLRETFPHLGRHRCGGDSRLEAQVCTPSPGEPEPDPRTDIAHLLEHVILDIQHFIADMPTCSGVTCAYRRPAGRFDLFIESPGRDISRLGVGLAVGILSRILGGDPPDPVYASAVRLARAVRDHRPEPITPAAARGWLRGRPPGLPPAHLEDEADADRALGVLHDQGFVSRFEASVEFSGMPLYHANDDPSPAHAADVPMRFNLDLSSP